MVATVRSCHLLYFSLSHSLSLQVFKILEAQSPAISTEATHHWKHSPSWEIVPPIFPSLVREIRPFDAFTHGAISNTRCFSSAELGRKIMVEHDVFVERPQIRVTHTLFCGCTDIAFSSYGDYWRQAKTICVVELLTQRRVKMFQLVREEEVSRMIENITQCCHNGSEIAACEMFKTIANNISSRSVLGLTSELERVSNELHAFLDQVIEDRLAMMNDGDDYTSDNKSFVDILLQLQLDGKLDISLTQDNLRAILLVYFSFHPLSPG
ncbi:Cytochrome P450 71A1 [Hibiscus syriacus]|uniref:Cytochrome P450 71A1 n=1 Tax=Hibiscus syriacus TaxID=106335 RepID=A0A6A2XAL0_HIBSY|nr:Cytochrome P450 71A1 [Hibiscus syriacus]